MLSISFPFSVYFIVNRFVIQCRDHRSVRAAELFHALIPTAGILSQKIGDDLFFLLDFARGTGFSFFRKGEPGRLLREWRYRSRFKQQYRTA